jgi:hypothetical protein
MQVQVQLVAGSSGVSPAGLYKYGPSDLEQPGGREMQARCLRSQVLAHCEVWIVNQEIEDVTVDSRKPYVRRVEDLIGSDGYEFSPVMKAPQKAYSCS